LPDGMVRNQRYVKLVVGYFKIKKIVVIFIPHCNFGTEGAASMIAKEMGFQPYFRSQVIKYLFQMVLD